MKNIKKIISIALCAVMLLCTLVPMSVSAEEATVGYDESLVLIPSNLDSIQDIKDYDATAHSELTQFKITDVAGWKKFVELTSSLTTKPGTDNKYYRFKGVTVYLAEDLDFQNEAGIAPVGGWNNDGSNIMCPGWSGTFDGLGHTIKNLTIEAPTGLTGKIGEGYIGLFRSVTRYGSIKNLILDSTVTISAGEYNTVAVGALVGSINTNSESNAKIAMSISNIYNKANVIGQANSAGSIVGRTYQVTLNISNCTNEGNITTKAFVGTDIAVGHVNNPAAYGNGVGGFIGIAGTEASGSDRTSFFTITDCINKGTITSDHAPVGGIVGAVGNGQNAEKFKLTIDNCVNSGVLVQNSDYNAGGILGDNHQTKVTADKIVIKNSAFNGVINTKENYMGYIGAIANGSSNMTLTANKVADKDFVLAPTDMSIYGVQPSLDRYTAKEGTSDAYEAFGVRIISLHNNISAQSKIEYNVTLTLGSDKYFNKYETNKVYTALIADGEQKTASVLGGENIATLRIDNIPVGEYETITVTVVPVVTDTNGNTFAGNAISVTVTVPSLES